MSSKKNRVRKWKLYCIIDSKAIHKKNPVKIALRLFKKGVKVVQLRYKNCPSDKLISIVKKIRPLADTYGASVLINDRVDVALAGGASGVHLGPGDMTVGRAQAFLGPGAIIGKTLHSIEEAKKARHEELDYVSAGPVFPTPFKNLKAKGINFIKKIKRRAPVPLFAIGGINKENAGGVLKSGADGICVIRAIFQDYGLTKKNSSF